MIATTPDCLLKRDLCQAAARLPSSARIFEKINEALRNPEVPTQEIIDIVKQDSAVALRVLRLANSVQFVRGEPFASLELAVDWIGLTHLFHLLTATASACLFCESLPHYGLSADHLGHNAMATATAIHMLAQTAGEDPRRAYSLGLFRPVGRMVLQRLAVRRELPVPPRSAATHQTWIDWEQTSFGINNAEAVTHLFSAWGLHPSLGACIQHHYHPLEAPESPETTATALLHVACWVAGEAGFGLPVEANAWTLSPRLLELARLPKFRPETYVRRVQEITARVITNPARN
jgi:HD-like signal output (HDOD) protein